jgi:raffinose/stachyose/melibiose transport system substrate-binding protein
MLRNTWHDRARSLWQPSKLWLGAAALGIGLASAGSAVAQSIPEWDDYTIETQSKVIEQILKKFQDAHPGVTIQRTARTFDDLSMTLKLTVSSGDGPIITKVNQGAGDMGAMVKEKLLVPVDPYAEKYGWAKGQSDSVLARDRWSDKGQFGEGANYGISGLGELVGLYYNAKVLKDAGIETPPATFEEFTADLDKLKEKGVTPIMIGTVKQHMALHLLAAVSQAQISATDRKSLDDLVYGRGGTWKTPGNLKAAQLVHDWATKGYFFSGYQGISADDADQLFSQGQAAFMITGTWYLGDQQTNPDIHFMRLPPPAGVKAPLIVGGVDLAWAITSVAKDQKTKDLAGEYLNYMVSDEAANEWASAGFLPAVAIKDLTKIKVSPLLGEAIGVWNTINSENALGHYPDWASPTMLKTFDDNLPVMLADGQTPEALIDALEKDYTTYLATLKK